MKLLGFNAVDLSNKEAQIGVVEDVRCCRQVLAVLCSHAHASCPAVSTMLDSCNGYVTALLLQVLEGEASAQPLLVVRAQCAGQAGAGSREEHFIPYVPQIVPRVDLAAGANVHLV
jgi:hypothetical protein